MDEIAFHSVVPQVFARVEDLGSDVWGQEISFVRPIAAEERAPCAAMFPVTAMTIADRSASMAAMCRDTVWPIGWRPVGVM